jgi:hypothetical protein
MAALSDADRKRFADRLVDCITGMQLTADPDLCASSLNSGLLKKCKYGDALEFMIILCKEVRKISDRKFYQKWMF